MLWYVDTLSAPLIHFVKPNGYNLNGVAQLLHHQLLTYMFLWVKWFKSVKSDIWVTYISINIFFFYSLFSIRSVCVLSRWMLNWSLPFSPAQRGSNSLTRYDTNWLTYYTLLMSDWLDLYATNCVPINIFLWAFWSIALEKIDRNGKIWNHFLSFSKTVFMVAWGGIGLFGKMIHAPKGRWKHNYVQIRSNVVKIYLT